MLWKGTTKIWLLIVSTINTHLGSELDLMISSAVFLKCLCGLIKIIIVHAKELSYD